MWIALVLFAAAVLLWPTAPMTPRDLSVIRSDPDQHSLDPKTRRALVIMAALVAVSALFLPSALSVAVPMAMAAGVMSRRLPIKPSADLKSVERRQLAMICDLVATCLTSGMPIGSALTAVLDQAVPGDIRRNAAPSAAVAALRAVAALLMLGADAARAWIPADSVAELAPIAAAARRSTVGGIGLAQAVRDQTAALGLEVAQDLERRAGRAGVLMAAPLGLCFLPAFVCLGLAPVIIALLRDLGIG